MTRILGVTTLAVVALSVVLIGTASAAKSPPTTASGCPNGGTYLVDPNVGADFTGTTTRTYTFSSWVDQNPVNGVPGLVGYCVYTNQTPTSVTPKYNSWKASKAGQTFSFTRPNGEKTNIPLDGTTGITVGEAVFGAAPTSQQILLHVSDAATCHALYGGDATTCFVLPGPKPGPVCDAGAGNTNAGYNAMPFDVVHCSPPALGFEANQTNEFGDEVLLDTTSGTKIHSLNVVFNSFGCSTSGHWNTGDCVTTNSTIDNTPGADTFTIPMSGGDPAGLTAHIYAMGPSDTVGAEIGTATNTDPIPFRPSADNVKCTNPGTDATPGDNDTGKWFDPIDGNCKNSLAMKITFNFSSPITVPSDSKVIWTVTFNTSTEGYNPIGLAPCSVVIPSDSGCGYDSLNVGAMTYPNSPYAGTDVDQDVAFWSYLGNGNVLTAEPGWTDNRPLGEVILGS